MACKPKKQIWINPQFQQDLKILAAKKNKSILDLSTADFGMKKTENKKKKQGFEWGF